MHAPAATSWTVPVAGGEARICFSTRADGDFGVSGAEPVLAARRRSLVDRPWTWLRQVHGAGTVRVDEPGGAAGSEADAAVTDVVGAALAVHVADCAPVALVAPEGIVAAVHAGWRGLAAGVVDAAVDGMQGLGATRIEAVVGPCIHPECYEFGAGDLEALARRFGEQVRGRTAGGRPALDLPRAVYAALRRRDVVLRASSATCTSCASARCFSHRARADTGRHAFVVWIEPHGGSWEPA